MGEDIMISLKNLDECSKFLWGEPGGEKVRRMVDRLVEIFQVEKGNLRPIIVSALQVLVALVEKVPYLHKLCCFRSSGFLSYTDFNAQT